MALTNVLTPASYMPVYNDLVQVDISSNSGETEMSYIYELYVNNVLKDTLEIEPDLNGYGVFNSHKLVEGFISFDLFTASASTITTVNSNTVNLYRADVTEKYVRTWEFDDDFFSSGSVGFTSNTSSSHYYSVGDRISVNRTNFSGLNASYNGVHTVTSVPDAFGVVTSTGFGISTPAISGNSDTADGSASLITDSKLTGISGYTYNGAIKHNDWIDYTPTDYVLTGENTNMLTNQPTGMTIGFNDKAYVNIMFEESTNTAITTNFAWVIIDTINSSGVFSRYQLNHFFAVDILQEEHFLQLGTGTQNLNAYLSGDTPVLIGFPTPIIKSDTIKYSAYTANNLSGRTSQILSYNIVDDTCRGYEKFRVLFQDRLGAFQGYNFSLVSRETVGIKRDTYQQTVGSFDPTTQTWGYNIEDRGKTVLDTDLTDTFRVIIDWVTDADSKYIVEEMLTSPLVYWQRESDAAIIPVILKTNKEEVKKIINDQLINHTIIFELANKDVRQRG